MVKYTDGSSSSTQDYEEYESGSLLVRTLGFPDISFYTVPGYMVIKIIRLGTLVTLTWDSVDNGALGTLSNSTPVPYLASAIPEQFRPLEQVFSTYVNFEGSSGGAYNIGTVRVNTDGNITFYEQSFDDKFLNGRVSIYSNSVSWVI